jgi:opacity protein-like surface antigen
MKKVVVVALALSSLVRHAVADDHSLADTKVDPASPVVVNPQYGSDQQAYHHKLVAEKKAEESSEVSDDESVDQTPDASSDVISEAPSEVDPEINQEINSETPSIDTSSVQSPESPETSVSDPVKNSMHGAYIGIEGALHHIGKYAPASAKEYVPGAKSVNANGARLSLGYRINDNLAVELGYLTGLSTHVENTHSQATAHVQGADLSVLYHMTVVVPGVYFRGGMSYLNADASSSVNKPAEYRTRPLHNYVNPTRYDREQRRGVGLVAGIGYETAVSEHVLLNAGYTRYQGVAGNKHNAMDVVNIGAKYTF